MGASSASISPTSKDKPKAVYEMVNHITNVNLKIFLDKEFETGQLNIDSISNRFDFPASPGKENIGIHMVLKAKFDESWAVFNEWVQISFLFW